MTESTLFLFNFLSQHDIKIDPKVCNAYFSQFNQFPIDKNQVLSSISFQLNILLHSKICQITEAEWVVNGVHHVFMQYWSIYSK